jgi:V/A-type H+-transporting ATPase subunit E
LSAEIENNLKINNYMDVKIQELTDKIYREGVEKGNEEAGRIIAEANEQKRSILHDAETEAGRIVATAEKQAAGLKKNAESELKWFAAQFLEDLKSEITSLIAGRIISSNVQPLTQDSTYMQKVILEIAKGWAGTEGLVIQSTDAEALSKYFEANTKDMLDKGDVKLEKINGKPASFTIMPADGTYKVAFGEEEFSAFFKEFLRPQLIELLF